MKTLVEDKDPIHYDTEYLQERGEFDTLEEIVCEDWYSLFEDYEMVLVEGSMGTWRGRREMTPQVIFSTLISDILEHINIYDLSFKFHKDHVEVINAHHDGINYYTIRPFKYELLTVKELWTIILKDYERSDVANLYDLKSKEVNKQALVDFCHDTDIELLYLEED